MINRILLVMAAALVFTVATPSYATFWNSQSSGRSYKSSKQNDNDHKQSKSKSKKSKSSKNQKSSNFNDCDWDFDWLCELDFSNFNDCKEPKRDDDCDWSFNWDCDWEIDCDEPQEPCDNPVPEPATAGLAFMSLGALTAAVRRRRK